ncbi:DUF998 domain-containing protein [Peloplasma aerotolerans]|uniref:DUF998 domain-containing protein n=1 Tax=Peloplasma aerotolerans TaxID=3044389 RepID=A0AAW6U9V4_9MOLU|nr:DUF998 domain-containing protein [Mariniplasma sp. M4Ah]MDI6452861.1 DUF998 domain-containing protein [Mariniplasma sp. M4Ah]MDR4969516.1 DUF998 domain-containing protein [Acholeplasmataceae bacterium]
MINKNKLRLTISVLGVIAIVSYLTHVVVGRFMNSDYHWLSQAISDLTADQANGVMYTRFFSYVYGFLSFITLWCIVYLYKAKTHKLLYIGLILFASMLTVSAIGYALFPLSESGYIGNFQNVMHMIVTGLVVLSTIASLIFMILGYKKIGDRKGLYISILTLFTLIVSGGLMGLINPAYFGLIERFSVYSVIFYFGYILYDFIIRGKESVF